MQTKLFVSSEVPIFQIFSDEGTKEGTISDHQRSVMDDLVRNLLLHFSRSSLTIWQGLADKGVGTSSMFTGEEEIFAFARCCSRLVQMGSKEWAETAGQ